MTSSGAVGHGKIEKISVTKMTKTLSLWKAEGSCKHSNDTLGPIKGENCLYTYMNKDKPLETDSTP